MFAARHAVDSIPHAGVSPISHFSQLSSALEQVLFDMPSQFQRLAYVATLDQPIARIQFSRRFLTRSFSDRDWDVAITRAHHAAFLGWLSLSLREKLADIAYLATRRGQTVAELMRHWANAESDETLIPRGVSEPERMLFHNDMGLLRTLAGAKAVAAS